MIPKNYYGAKTHFRIAITSLFLGTVCLKLASWIHDETKTIKNYERVMEGVSGLKITQSILSLKERVQNIFIGVAGLLKEFRPIV
jgi:hypothetical protein